MGLELDDESTGPNGADVIDRRRIDALEERADAEDGRFGQVLAELSSVRAAQSELSGTLIDHGGLLAKLVQATGETQEMLGAITRGMGVTLAPKGMRQGSSAEIEQKVEKRVRTRADWAKLAGAITAVAIAAAAVLNQLAHMLGGK